MSNENQEQEFIKANLNDLKLKKKSRSKKSKKLYYFLGLCFILLVGLSYYIYSVMNTKEEVIVSEKAKVESKVILDKKLSNSLEKIDEKQKKVGELSPPQIQVNNSSDDKDNTENDQILIPSEEDDIFGDNEKSTSLNKDIRVAVFRGSRLSLKKAKEENTVSAIDVANDDNDSKTLISSEFNNGGERSNLAKLNKSSNPKLVDVVTTTRINPSYLLGAGVYIPCVLNNRIESNFAGFINCSLDTDIYSYDGKNILLPKGTTVFGKYQTSSVAEGDNRLFIIWEKVRTPKLLTINIEPVSGVDNLGVVGAEGVRDNKFWKRFGSAIAISMVSDLNTLGVSVLSGQLGANQNKPKGKDDLFYTGDGATFTENTRVAIQQVVGAILKESVNIKPTITINQGTVLGLILNKDIDFSNIYLQ